MEHTGKLNAAWASALVDGMMAAGVEHAVISPGARNTPLTLACFRHAGITVHMRIDERSAAFFALGLAKADGKPVAVICTSGSAVANWHPAVTEADMARAPLVLVSADRPPELQDCGAHQSIDQARLFGPSLRSYHSLPPAEPDASWLANFMARCVQQSVWPLPGPVQVNCAFREPMLAPADYEPPVFEARRPRVILPKLTPPAFELRALAEKLGGRRGVIVCGCEEVPTAPVARLAEALNVPILADPLCGLRFGSHDKSRVFARYDTFLRAGGFTPEWILRFGAFPLSKPYANWLSGVDCDRIVVSGDSRWPDPKRAAEIMIQADLEAVALGMAAEVKACAPDSWVQTFRDAEDEAEALIQRLGPPEVAISRAMIDSLPDGSLLFIGNSMAVRDLDAYSGISGKNITVMANRGVAGIDGLVSTFLGAVASGRYTKAAALLGDLTFSHDIGGLASTGLDAVICVLDNGGGMIFQHLPPVNLPAHEYEKGWYTPPGADIGAAAAIWGHGHTCVETTEFATAFAAALAEPLTKVVQIKVDREQSTLGHRALWNAAAHPQLVLA
jgi:2-succinyl-5-enolpyruvyl-6-hydroxy-3-cyclohexene-1-carboxylate synthase